MAHFAHVDPNTNIVTQVIVIEPEVLKQAGGWYIGGIFRDIGGFIETSKVAFAFVGRNIITGERVPHMNTFFNKLKEHCVLCKLAKRWCSSCLYLKIKRTINRIWLP